MKITQADDKQSGWTATPSRLIGALISDIPTMFTPDALPDKTLPIYPGSGQAPNMACIPGGCMSGLSGLVTEMIQATGDN